MKAKVERPVGQARLGSGRRLRDNGGEMPPGLAPLAPVRKKLRGLRVCAPAHIVDRLVWHAEVAELESDEGREVAMGSIAAALHDCTPTRSVLHRASHFFADLERFDADVRAYRNEELCRIVRQGVNHLRNDARYCAAPPCVRRSDVSARRVSDQDRHAIGRAGGNSNPVDSCDQCVPFPVRDRRGKIAARNLVNASAVHLPLLEKTIARDPDGISKARSILANRGVVIPKVKAEIEGVVGGDAHPTRTSRKRMAKAVPL